MLEETIRLDKKLKKQRIMRYESTIREYKRYKSEFY